MSDTLNQIFGVLDSDLTWLRIRWQWYKQLFASGESRIRLLNDSGSTFFVDLRRILIDDVILGICRMTEEAGSGERQNATMEGLVNAANEEGLGELGSKLRLQLHAIEKASEPMRTHRNKRVGHRDRKVALEPEKNPLPSVNAGQFDLALKEMGKFLNTFQFHFGENSTLYDFVNVAHGAEVLVERLKEGAVFNRMLREDPSAWYPKKREGPFQDA